MKKERKRRRSKLEIVNNLLNKLEKRKKSGLAQTKLQQESNLDYIGFKSYFDELIENELIRKINSSRCRKRIYITELGEGYLEESEEILLRLEKLNKKFKIDLKKIIPHTKKWKKK